MQVTGRGPGVWAATRRGNSNRSPSQKRGDGGGGGGGGTTLRGVRTEEGEWGAGMREGRRSTFSLIKLGDTFTDLHFRWETPSSEEVISPQMADWMTKQNSYVQVRDGFTEPTASLQRAGVMATRYSNGRQGEVRSRGFPLRVAPRSPGRDRWIYTDTPLGQLTRLLRRLTLPEGGSLQPGCLWTFFYNLVTQ